MSEEVEKLIVDKGELAYLFEQLDSDAVDDYTSMSTIDLNTRLSNDEIKLIAVIDELMREGILPEDVSITRQLKRLKVSLEGQGRKEKVSIVQGEREQRTGFGNKLSNMFKRS